MRWIARSDLIPATRAKHADTLLSKPVLTFGRGTAPQIAVEVIVQTLARRAGVPFADTQVTGLPSVAVIVKLLRDGYGIAAVPALFVEPFLASGELGHLQVRPLPPPINVAMYYRARRRRRRAGGRARRSAMRAISMRKRWGGS